MEDQRNSICFVSVANPTPLGVLRLPAAKELEASWKFTGIPVFLKSFNLSTSRSIRAIILASSLVIAALEKNGFKRDRTARCRSCWVTGNVISVLWLSVKSVHMAVGRSIAFNPSTQRKTGVRVALSDGP